MPAKSRSQQKLFGMVHACQKKDKCASEEIKKIAKSMSKKDAEEFASTKHKGLPNKIKKKNRKRSKKVKFSEWLTDRLKKDLKGNNENIR